jgi:hypothetical protein
MYINRTFKNSADSGSFANSDHQNIRVIAGINF